jgi:hypothetical protein
MYGSSDPAAADLTEAMVEAGFEALKNSYIKDECLESDKLLVVEIYLAMRRVALQVPVRH